MSDIISFSKAKKKNTKAEKEKQASENRLKFGRTKLEKKLEILKVNKADKNLSDHKIKD
ncbi:MAG: DUF4169 family protein [Kordiimonadaceae bacterium]|jgi:hypothetical protein|nr:DUF4169 family protein [Kordiimonadaceae bacterium]MBT6033715.1 DUF4169 family protein [Kordiimonadaceae bacterium]